MLSVVVLSGGGNEWQWCTELVVVMSGSGVLVMLFVVVMSSGGNEWWWCTSDTVVSGNEW